MNFHEIKNQLAQKKIDKQSFINKMYDNHLVLKNYVDFLKDSGISNIEITDTGLFFTSRSTTYHSGGIKFKTNIVDKRVTPLEAFNFGKYEDDDSEMIYKLIEDDFIVFDIGGNIGWYTTHIAKILTKGKVYAFEPIPDTFKNLTENVDVNGLKNVILNNIALSDSKGELVFYYSPKMTGASSSQNITSNENAILVECVTNTLDSYMEENNIEYLSFIKCDVEGAELFAFKGCVQTLALHKPIVFTEMLRKWSAKFNYHPNDIIQLFSGLGYGCFKNENAKLVQIESINDETVETNFFFLHFEKHAEKINQLS